MIWVTLRNTQGATLALSWLVRPSPPLLGAAWGHLCSALPAVAVAVACTGRAAAPQDHVTPRRARPGSLTRPSSQPPAGPLRNSLRPRYPRPPAR